MTSTSQMIQEMYKSYTETAEAALAAESAGEEYEEQPADEWITDWALSVDKKTIVDIALTLGGPNVFIRCVCSPGQHYGLELDSATFIAAWGSDTKETRLDSSDALWQVAERYIDCMD